MPRLKLDLTREVFGYLTVVREYPEPDKNGYTRWICSCKCGSSSVVRTGKLRSGQTLSCGCLQKEKNITHGLSHSPEYSSWSAIKSRCYNQAYPGYTEYGGSGITMCVEWRDSFEAFYRDMGPRPTPEHSVDRRDGTQGYYPHNCRWATVIEQNNNTKKNIRFEYRGEMKTLAEWCRELKLKYQTVYYRITELKWTFAEAVTPIESMPITFDGETKSLEAWCDMLGLRPNETYIRILRGVAFDVIVAE